MSLASRFPSIKEVRGKGLLIGVELAFDPKGIIPLCKEKGLLLIKAEHNTVRFMPPLIVADADIDAALAIFEEVLALCAK
jgi:acetylornithine/succinyldiaminopimelate/putrescine aminotransferase